MRRSPARPLVSIRLQPPTPQWTRVETASPRLTRQIGWWACQARESCGAGRRTGHRRTTAASRTSGRTTRASRVADKRRARAARTSGASRARDDGASRARTTDQPAPSRNERETADLSGHPARPPGRVASGRTTANACACARCCRGSRGYRDWDWRATAAGVSRTDSRRSGRRRSSRVPRASPSRGSARCRPAASPMCRGPGPLPKCAVRPAVTAVGRELVVGPRHRPAAQLREATRRAAVRNRWRQPERRHRPPLAPRPEPRG